MHRRSLLTGAALLPLTTPLSRAADGFPNRPIRIIVPAAAGLAVDACARYFANKLAEKFNVAVNVENIPGVGGVIGYNQAAKARPDGYTLIITGIPFYLLPLFYKDAVTYDPLKSFTALARVSYVPQSIAVSTESPLRTMKDLVDQMKAKEGQLRFGSQGLGSSQHVCSTVLNMATNTKAEHIQYKSAQGGVVDVVANRIDFMCLSPTVWIPLREAGKVRVLAVTGPHRQKTFADVPTMAEAGYPDADVTSMLDFLAPADTPEPIAKVLEDAFMEAAGTNEFKEISEKLMFIRGTMRRAEMEKAFPKEFEYWKKVAARMSVTNP